MEKSDLTAKTVAELKALARARKILLQPGTKKGEIIALLLSGPSSEKKIGAAARKKSSSPKKGAKSAPAKRPKTSKTAPARKQRRAPSTGPEKPQERPREEWRLPAGVEEPLLAQERVETSKFYTGPVSPRSAAGGTGELPTEYGEERLTLMARDPYVAFAYWEVTPGRLDREKQWFGWDSRLSVRIYDVTGIQFDGRNAVGYYDQDVSERVGNWYFGINRPGRSFVADIGLRSPSGRFLTLARSNYVTMPHEGVSDEIDEEWMITDEEFWKLYRFGEGLSSQEAAEMWRQRRLLHGVSSPGMSARRRRGSGHHA